MSASSSTIPPFVELFDLEEIQHIQDAFSDMTGLASIITNPLGVPITRASNFCGLCQNVIRKTDKGLRNCMISDSEHGKVNPEGPLMGPCLSGGLMCGGTSIMFGDQHMANWLIGQVLDEEADCEAMLAYGKTIGADPNEYAASLAQVRRLSRQQFNKYADTLFLFAKMISRQALQSHELESTVRDLSVKECQLRTKNVRMNLLVDKLEQAHSDLELFTYTMSHELKTPLVTISGYLGMIEHDLTHNNISKAQNALDKVKTAASTMRGLLEGLLNILEIDTKGMQTMETDLNQSLQKVVSALAHPIELAGISVNTVGDLPVIRAKPRLVYDLLMELMSNAIKFMGEQETPVISAGVLREGAFPLLFVEDNGLGIPDIYHERVFRMFEQLDKGASGTGTGLALVKRIVQLHGGMIRIESRSSGAGTRVCFTLPDMPA